MPILSRFLRTAAFLAFAASLLAVDLSAAMADMDSARRALAEKRDFTAFAEFRDMAEKGNAEAQFEIAGFYHYGRIGAANFKQALYWYERSAAQGYADAMIGLSVLYGKGEGVKRDPAIAYQWLKTARLQNIPADTATKIDESLSTLAKELSSDDLSKAEAFAQGFKAKPE